MAAKKPAKLKRPPAKKADARKRAPVKAAAKPAPKQRAAAPAARPAKPMAKPAPAKPSSAKPVAQKPFAAAKPQPPAKSPAVAAKPVFPVKTPPLPAAVLRRPGAPLPGLFGARPPGRGRGIGADADAEDDENALSLLAGPRNVKPYLAKKGEQYMGKAQLEHFRTILLSWKRDLMEEVDRTVTHMKDEAANPPDPNDRATLESEFSLELRTRDRERKLIRKIDEALKRIDDGSYGYCLETGEEIGIKRLEARPVATLSIEAQERRERREKQYGDRDDRYR